jgi:DNA (cytosine-5)-methyltransferase 1
MSQNFKMAELFCGPGGLALGALSASKLVNGWEIKPIWANDIDNDTCETYALNIHNGDNSNVYCSPVEQLNFDNTPDFDGLSFGFPCNDFSLVGEQKGTKGKYGKLYSYCIKAIQAKNPKWFIAENVGGLRSANDGKAFQKILHELENAGKGYRLTAHLYKFEQYGVPQKRHRIIIVGIRSDLELNFKVPAPTTPNEKNYKTAKEALTEPPIKDSMGHNELTKQSDQVVQRLKHTPAGKNAWYEGIPLEYQLNVKGAKLSQIYKRLDPNKPSYTITGSGGGGTHGYHWKEPRALTNRERARIQTFPDKFQFCGSKESVRKQIGMAVPPDGAKHIFKALLKTFAGTNYKSVDANISNKDIILDKAS